MWVDLRIVLTMINHIQCNINLKTTLSLNTFKVYRKMIHKEKQQM